MQLILDTEATIDIKEKMTTLEESPMKDLKDIENLKHDINNANKDNVSCEEKVTNNTEELVNGNNKDLEIKSTTTLPIENCNLEKKVEEKENANPKIENTEEEQIRENYTYKEDIFPNENHTSSENIVDEENFEICQTNGEGNIDTDKLNTVEKLDNILHTTLSNNEQEENADIGTTLSNNEQEENADIGTTLSNDEQEENADIDTTLSNNEQEENADIGTTLSNNEQEENADIDTTLSNNEQEKNANIDTILSNNEQEENANIDTALSNNEQEKNANIDSTLSNNEQKENASIDTTLSNNEQEENMNIDTNLSNNEQEENMNIDTNLSNNEQEENADIGTTLSNNEQEKSATIDTTLSNDEQEENASIDTTLSNNEQEENMNIDTTLGNKEQEENMNIDTNLSNNEQEKDANIDTTLIEKEDNANIDTTKNEQEENANMDDTLSHNVQEENENIDKDNVNDTMTDCLKSVLKEDNDRILITTSENVLPKIITIVNEKADIDDIWNDDNSKIDVEEDIEKIVDYLETTDHDLEMVACTSSIINNSDKNENDDKETDNIKIIEEELPVKVNESPEIIENSVKTFEKETTNNETLGSVVPQDNITKLNDNIVDNLECEEIKNNSDESVMEHDETENIIDTEETLEMDKTTETEIKEKGDNHRDEALTLKKPEEPKKIISKLSNTLDILSDDDDIPDVPSVTKSKIDINQASEKQCINIDDDDDIMLIDEDLGRKDSTQKLDAQVEKKDEENAEDSTTDSEHKIVNNESSKPTDMLTERKESPDTDVEICSATLQTEVEKQEPEKELTQKAFHAKPLLPENFLKTYKKNLVDMTRDDLEEFCILKIVESIVDRSNLSEIKSKLKVMAQNIDEYKKKAMMLTKQNRDLQVVLKSVQEEQKKKSDTAITPLKITRSVGMQVIMQEKPGTRKKPPTNANTNNVQNNRNVRTSNVNTRQQKQQAGANQQIPVPRLVPAHAPVTKPVNTIAQSPPVNNQNKTPSPVPNGVRPQKTAEKRPHSRVQSVTVDLTDDEPPSKIPPRITPTPPVRLVSPQSLLAPQRQPFGQTLSSPRKVYIPISGLQNQNIRTGQTIMLKSLPAPRQRCPTPVPRMPQNAVRMPRLQNRHPAPLPDAMKQYQPPNWKELPPAPDLKLSKVENGIVISWKIEGYQEDSYEEIASYQLYAYQETSSPPSTALWKKIGDVKALPLPMACTLTQFMAGFKYYFAVRAVDVRSRVGPFSLPGSILLLNKM